MKDVFVKPRPEAPMVLVGLLVILGLACSPAVAPAVAGEVHFDPESPAGTEYALPLPQARNEAIGGPAASGQGGGDAGGPGGAPAKAPLFGVGVRPAHDAPSGGDQAGRGGDGATAGGPRARGRREGQGGPGPNAPRTTRLAMPGRASAPRASYSLGSGLAIVVALLLLAALLGLALRVLSRGRSGKGSLGPA